MNTESRDAADGGIDAGEVDRLICQGLAPVELAAARHARLRARLLQRASESASRLAGLLTVRSSDGTWKTVKAGIRAKILHRGRQGSSVLIEFAPGASLPVHRHQQLEEGIILRGGLQLGELDLFPGDYHVSPAGSRHGRIASRQGGLAFLRGTSLGQTSAVVGELLGALVPGRGPAIRTISASEEGWQAIAAGVESKFLYQDGDLISRFVRLAPGGVLPAHRHSADEECLMLSGDAFLGDLLLTPGDYHLAPAGSAHGDVSSDAGALFFVRGQAEFLPLVAP
mgnify:CR=1 FL=1